jgi:site-specific DNA-methyltransferase (adenine-specific)
MPYYEQNGVTIYHGDCLKVLPELQVDADLVLTDPPWLARGKQVARRGWGVGQERQPSLTIGQGAIGTFSQHALRLAFRKTKADMLVICGYKELGKVIAVLEPIRGVFVWHKPNAGPSIAYPSAMDVAYIVWGAHASRLTGRQWWKSGVMSHNIPQAGCFHGERLRDKSTGKAAHPCQGPLSLYRQLLAPVKPGGLVLDPYMGTGTTLRAAKDLGLKAIGIEIEERYCEMAANRLRQNMLPWDESEYEAGHEARYEAGNESGNESGDEGRYESEYESEYEARYEARGLKRREAEDP